MFETSIEEKIYTIKDCESEFLKLIGYEVYGTNDIGYAIVDEFHHKVGYIQYKKLCKSDKKGNKDAVYGYVMEIDSPILKLSRTRKEHTKDEFYSFYFKRINGQMDNVELDLGDNPSFSMWSQEYGNMKFNVNSHKLFCTFKRKTNGTRKRNKEHYFDKCN